MKSVKAFIATQVGKETKRNHQTIMKWVHRYNQEGLGALKYQRTGGRKPEMVSNRRRRTGQPNPRSSGIGSSTTTGEETKTDTALDIKKIRSMASRSMED